MKKVLLLAFFLLIGSNSSFAANWVSVGNDVDGYEWSYDNDSFLANRTRYDRYNENIEYIVIIKKIHPDKSTWYKGDLVMTPSKRTAALIRWEKHKKNKDKYSYWTYEEEQKYYTSNTMYDSIGRAISENYY